MTCASARTALFIVFTVLSWISRAETTLVQSGKETTWRYSYGGEEPKPEWRSREFNDGTWSFGAGPVGYGEKKLGTILPYGADENAKPITAYFRHVFDVENVQNVAQLKFMIRSDDGIIVYINGQELVRDNLPPGDVTSTTTANKSLDGIDERLFRRYAAKASALVPGKNVLAVEVHQSDAKSDDLFLDVILRAYNAGEDPRPVLSAEAKTAAEAYRYKHRVEPGVKIPDGFADGGRSAVFEPDGHVTSRREVLIVNRSADTTLKELLSFAKSEEVLALEPVARAKRLAARIHALDDSTVNFPWMEAMRGLDTYSNEPVLIGDVAKICSTGVCRHRSLLFKLMGDEAGLGVALIKGNLNTGQRNEPHAWDELHLEDGTVMVVDVAYFPHDPVFKQDKAVIYYTDANKALYSSPEKPLFKARGR